MDLDFRFEHPLNDLFSDDFTPYPFEPADSACSSSPAFTNPLRISSALLSPSSSPFSFSCSSCSSSEDEEELGSSSPLPVMTISVLPSPLSEQPSDDELQHLRSSTPDMFSQLRPFLPGFRSERVVTAHFDGRSIFVFVGRNTQIKDDRVTEEFAVLKAFGFKQGRTAKPGHKGQSYLFLAVAECQRLMREDQERHRRQQTFLAMVQGSFYFAGEQEPSTSTGGRRRRRKAPPAPAAARESKRQKISSGD